MLLEPRMMEVSVYVSCLALSNMKIIIKKHRNRNDYLLTPNGLWVRDFTKNVLPRDINNLTKREDYQLLVSNETAIRTLNIPEIGSENETWKKCIIVSDGHNFDENKIILNQLPEDVCVIGVNRSLVKWKTTDGLLKRKMNFFVVNNPYEECMRYMPAHGYRPKCIISSRTYTKFVKKYNGVMYKYIPVSDQIFSGESAKYYQIDDYRNPICAAIGLAYKFKVQKLVLFGCDDVFDHERPAAQQLPNGLWMYPQHFISHHLIDGSLYWLRHQEDYDVEARDCSYGPIYNNASYIKMSDIKDFFNE